MTIVLIIVGVLLGISFFTGMGEEFWTVVNVAAVLAASLVLLIAPFFIKDEIFAIFQKAAASGEDKTALYAFLYALVFGVVGIVLGSPLIWAWKEKEYYIILGTLASKTNYSAGLGISIAIGIVFALPAGFVFAPAVEKMSIWLFIIPGAIATVISTIVFIPMVIKARNGF